MADRKHPKTHVEDQDLDELRKQPLSPLHEGIDPLTESDTMLPAEDTQAESVKLNEKEEKEALKAEKPSKKSGKKTAAKDKTQDESEQKELVDEKIAAQAALDDNEPTETDETSEPETTGGKN